jgi:hypothetical protein
MSTIKGGLATLIILAAALTAACGDSDGRPEWLHGTWELAFNPDRDSEDELTFNPNGTVVVQTADGRQISGQYQVNGLDLLLLLQPERNVVDVHFEIAPDHTRLVYKSGAYYIKKGPP